MPLLGFANSLRSYPVLPTHEIGAELAAVEALIEAAVNLITRLTNAITRLIATDYRVNPKLDEREQRMRNDLERVPIELGYGPEE